MLKSLKSKDGIAYWHKSWVIPPIKIVTKSEALQNCYCKIQSGIIIEGVYIVNEVEGENSKKFSNGTAIFKQLKFAQTCKQASSNGANFRLKLQIYDEKIKKEFISDEIFVDSKNNQTFTQGIFDVFEPESLKKQYFYIQKGEPDTKTLIENNMNGLLYYIKASNIKSKIKHPIFLAIYFSNVVKIFSKDLSKLFDSQSEVEIHLEIQNEEAQV